VTKVIRPPRPAGCRQGPPPPTSITEPFDDELAQRLQLHTSADEALRGVLAPGDRRHVRPSFRLYTTDLRARPRDARAREAMFAAWRTRWFFARTEDAQHLPMAALLSGLGRPLLCRNVDPAMQLLAYFVGRAVHSRIMAAYRSVYRANQVACDNRVFFPAGGSERLSELAEREPRSVYGALNWCLAGQRCDIIDLDRREMWEIKPAGLTSAALLQIWGYLDNYEVARVMSHYHGDPPVPPLSPGAQATLPRQVLKVFELPLTREVTLVIAPFTHKQIPGLILYTVRVKTRPKRPERARARQAVALTSADVEQVLVAARRDMQYMIEVKEAETRRLLIYAGVAVVVAAAALFAAAAVAAAAAGAGGAAVAGGVAAASGSATAGGLAGAELVVVSAEVVSLAAVRAASGVAVETIVAAAPRIAASVTIYFAGREFTLPPETVGVCIEGGCEMGEAATAGLPF
jgi:hypothetical protein